VPAAQRRVPRSHRSWLSAPVPGKKVERLALRALVLATALLEGTRLGESTAAAPAWMPPGPRVTTGDYLAVPPTREEFSSPAGNYVLVLSTRDNWQSQRSLAELWHSAPATRQRLWMRLLPHEFRPRYVVVGPNGEVLLLDEWINVRSRYAVMLLDAQNHVLAQYGFDSIQRILGVPAAEIVAKARHGWWITSPPAVEGGGDRARVETAGRQLFIRLRDGHLSVGH
jgi:hypothetical protein